MFRNRLMQTTSFLFSPDGAGGASSGAAAGAGAGNEGGGTHQSSAGGGAGASGDKGGANANGDGSFHSLLPEDLRGDPALKDFKDITGLAKSYISVNKMTGWDKIPVPPKDATPEQISAFHERLGRPKDVKGYEFKEPEGLKNPIPVIPEVRDSFAQTAFKLGLTKAQTEGLYSWYRQSEDGIATNYSSAAQRSYEEGLGKLQSEWGAKFDVNVNVAKAAVRTYGGDDFVGFLNETKVNGVSLGSHPLMIRFMNKVGSSLGEDELRLGGTPSGVYSPDEAKSVIAQKQRDPEFMKAYNDSSHAGHDAAVKEMTQLYKFANPEQPRK